VKGKGEGVHNWMKNVLTEVTVSVAVTFSKVVIVVVLGESPEVTIEFTRADAS